MTKLIVRPVDPALPGSYRVRRRITRLMAAVVRGENREKVVAMADPEEAVIEHLETDDGTPVEDALDAISSDQFDELLSELLKSPVPTTSAAS